MQVISSSLAMGAVHASTDTTEVQHRLEIRRGTVSGSAATELPRDEVELLDRKALVARLLYQQLTGDELALMPSVRTAKGASAAAPARASWSVSYSRQETHHESERSVFIADGSVTLESGKKVDFSLKLEMNRERTEINGVAFQAGNMKDPIAVNLDGLGVRLTSDKQAFDLTGDGLDETIATLAEGSAWLARDTNSNGKVDNGAELFGPQSGQGFAELAALDEDRNGWITQSDSGYGQLGLWNNGALTSLRDAGIAALSVDSVRTPFALKEGAEVLGQVRQSGVYLREDGTPGALQELDLKV